MRKILPKQAGFTLVELLVVVSIIAILALIGLTIFSGLQRTARDVARKGDIDALSKALEVNKTDIGYQTLAASQFAGGSIPQVDSQGYPYCINTSVNAADAVTTDWTNVSTTTDDGITTPASCPADYSTVNNTQPAANSTQYKICARLEHDGAAATVFCKSNQQ